MSDETVSFPKPSDAAFITIKKPWESKTVWINFVIALTGAVSLFAPGASVISDWIKAHGDTLAVFWGLLNIVIRSVTKDHISLVD